MRLMRRRVALAATLLALVALTVLLWPLGRGLALVIRAAEVNGGLRAAADLAATPTREYDLRIPRASGALRGRAYEPARGVRRTALVVTGLHPAGIDEPRLVRLSRELAASGIAVVTPDIPELSQFTISASITDAIEQAATWLALSDHFAPDGRVGMMGISFSGGLTVVAAGRPGLRDRVAYVFSFGGHGDLPRVLRYLATGVEPTPPATFTLQPERPLVPPPHDYGVAVVLLSVADRVVPPPQVEPLRTALRRFLWASYLDRYDKTEASREFAAVRKLARSLPEPSATLLGYVNDRDVARLGSRLLPYVGLYGTAPALSPSRSPKPAAPVFLMHGIDDNVIPAVESAYLANDLRGQTPVRLLLTRIISHAEVTRDPGLGEILKLAAFWGDLLGR